MSTSALMSVGVRAMAASYAALQTTGNNIANANTPGYSRQTVDLATSPGQYTGAGFFGRGVDVTSVTRSYDQFLTRSAWSTASTAASDKARSDQLTQLQNAFPLGTTGIGYAAGQFFSAMSDLASDPQDSSARQVVLSQASSLASRIGDSSTQLDSLQSGLNQDLATSVKSVNSIATNIAKVNQQIAAVQGAGQPPNDLLDQRDQLVAQLSALTQVTTIPASDGTVGVFISGGQRLVLGNAAVSLQVTQDQSDPSRSAIAINDNGSVRNLDSDSIGGSIGGLLNFQNTDLEDARNQLGQLSAAMAGRVNQQQALGLDLGTPAAAGAPIFAVGAPQAVAATTNAKDANGNYLASVTLTTADATQLQASDYTLKADPANAGQYNLTRQSDGLVRSVASGDTVDGMTITIGSPAPGPNDSFLLQPVAHAASGFTRVLDDPNGVAAASPISGTMPPTNTGTATIASLTVTDSSNDPTLTAAISFTDATGDYSYSMTDSGGNEVSSGTGTWVAGTPIKMNGFSLSLNGVPASGDQVSVTPTLNPKTSNGNALAMTAMQDETFVGRTTDASGNPSGGATMTDAYAAAMADVGVRVQSATNTASISASVATTAQSDKTAQSGVNLDEEAARLIQFQQSYQAAAKVLSVAQQIFDTLLQTAGAA